MSDSKVLKDITKKLNSAGIEFMLTGSYAMTFYFKPRMTRDIDIVVALTRKNLENFINIFKEDYYLSEESIKDSVDKKTVFNILNNEHIFKVDCIVEKNTEYSQTAFKRKASKKLDDMDIFVISLEDLIISKLLWSQDSRSTMQIRDIQDPLTLSLEEDYLHFWIQKLNLHHYFKELKS